MAAVTLPPGYAYGPPTVRPRRRWWLIGVVTAWVLVLAGLAVWSVRSDPPTVPEQRDIGEAVPFLQQATGAMLAAAQGPDRAVVLGELSSSGCRITPVRDGLTATRGVTVYVQADQAGRVLAEIAAALPRDYRAIAAQSRSGARVGLQADAGHYIALDADSQATAQVFTLEASTGCRPLAAHALDSPDPAAGRPAPAALAAAIRALGATGDRVPPTTVRGIRCPSGDVAATWTVAELSAPSDLGRALQPVLTGATVVRSDPDGWAYRTGPDSVVVTRAVARVRLSVTTACR
jgi:hypothetical protein